MRHAEGAATHIVGPADARSSTPQWSLGPAVTTASGVATKAVPTKYVSNTRRPIRAVFAGDTSFAGSSAEAFAYRQ